jgi:hypothetical protein
MLRAATALFVVLTLSITMTITTSTASGAGAAAPSGSVVYRAPTDAPIVDHFRPPKAPWGPGNRGIDFATDAGAIVGAVGDGTVVFAGEVGGTMHVTVEHADGLRSSSSFLASILVGRGDHVRRGEALGIAAGPFHLGMRTPEGTYLDPEAVLSGSIRPSIHLIPGAEEGLDPLSEQERRSLMQSLFDTGSAAVAHLTRTGAQVAALAAQYANDLAVPAIELRAAVAFARWAVQRMHCTGPGVAVPTQSSRRIVIEVSGLGTASSGNSAWEFDTEHLGYRPADVVRFSYNGGRVPVDGLLTAGGGASSGWSEFDRIDSQQPIGTSADRLAALVASTARANPGVPIDVFAHSQGGVVARLAIERAASAGRLPAEIATLVTVGSPHAGAPLATAVAAVGLTPTGRGVLGAVRSGHLAGELDDRLPAVTDLAATSAVMAELHATPMPEQVRFVSLGGSGDLVVPGTATVDPQADDQRIVPTAFGTAAHGDLPADPRVTRELALAVAGEPLTCQGFAEAAGAYLQAEAVSIAESGLGAGVAVGAAVSPPMMDPGAVLSSGGD